MQVRTVPISELRPHPKNPRAHPNSSLAKLEMSISEYGFTNPVLATADGMILAGHGRVQAAQRLGLVEVPVIFLDIDGAKADAYVIADNYIAELSTWDDDLLKGILSELKASEVDASITGLSDEDIAGLIEGVAHIGPSEVLWDEIKPPEPEAIEDDFYVDEALDTIEEPITQRGDIWVLGRNRLMCGDSTNADNMALLMDGCRADMVFTDPPYGLDYSGGRTQVVQTKDYGRILNDDLVQGELGDIICNAFTFNQNEADIYICVSPIIQKPFLDYIESRKRIVDAVIVWDKGVAGLGYMAYRRRCEFIIYLRGKPFQKNDKSDFDLWSIPKDDPKSYLIGVQKPVAVPARAITNSSQYDDIVLDIFGGAGSTMIAAEQLGRMCFMMELDERFCDVIVKRWEQYTGLKAERFPAEVDA